MIKRKEKIVWAAVVGLAFGCIFAAEQNVKSAGERLTSGRGGLRRAEFHVDGQEKQVREGLVEVEKKCVVLDAGHGGFDPGKVGINGAQEQDVNLAIALLVKQYLEQEDVRVVMTRETGEGLYDENATNKKVQDMKRRTALIDEAKPDATVSIHQNSYPEEYVHGAQVFFYANSTEGRRLAESLQKSLIRRVDPENSRGIKPNDSYYLLKKTSSPIVIVECGFLSNSREAELLCSEDYQEKLAWAIHMGILQYLNMDE